MIVRVAPGETSTVELPGRTLHAFLRAGDGRCRTMSVHRAAFPGRSRPEGHVHAAEDEAVYVLSVSGRIVTPGSTAELQPGVFVLIPSGTFHATESGDQGLELLCVFSPPVVLGSYETAPA